MTRVDAEETLHEQITTSEDEQNEDGPADTFYDADREEFFTVEALTAETETVEVDYYWGGEEAVPIDEFRARFKSRRYGRIDRETDFNHLEAARDFARAAYVELRAGRDLDDEFEPMGVSFRDIRYVLTMKYGPDLWNKEE